MKHALPLILAAIAVLSALTQANGQERKHRNKHKLTEIPELQRVVEKYNADGSIVIADNTRVSNDDILRYLDVSEEMTFDLQNKRQSQFKSSTTYLRFQQYYKGVKVENGGYAIKSDSELPGGEYSVKQFSPFVYYDVNINTDPAIEESDIAEILAVNSVRSAELLITDRFDGVYNLVWKVLYSDPHLKYSWINAKNGKILHTTDAMMYKNAPTEDYDTQNMQDVNDDGTTYLQTELNTATNGGLITYDFRQRNLYEIEISDYTSDLIPTSDSSAAWSTSHADESVFQAHWIVKEIRDMFLSEFNIDYELLHVGANCDNYIYFVFEQDTIFIPRPNAGAFPDATTEEGWIIIGHSENSTLAEYDILGHELGHVFLNTPLDYTYITAGSLHEGIADMFGVYMESKFQSLDWKMGDDVPYIVRDLQNPQWNCYTQVISFDGKHARSVPLGYWFYLLVTGDGLECGGPMEMKTILDVVIDALQLVTSDADYPDLREATLLIVEQEFGEQSEEYATMLNAWNKICVNQINAPGQDVHVTSSTTWSTNSFINYDIYVENGATLTITSTLTMDAGVDIFVEDNSVLILNGGTLTTDTCELWNGIDVAGEFGFFTPVIEDAGEGPERGQVILKNGALIERAETAIDAKDRYTSPYGIVYILGGGIVEIRNSTIRECIYGVRFGRYGWGYVIGSNIDDQSIIDSSVFENNKTPIYSEYNLGLEIHNTVFKGNKGTDYEGYGSKITALNDTFTRNVIMLSPYPVVPGSIISKNVFDGCPFATQSQGNYTPLVLEGNVFSDPPSEIVMSGEVRFIVEGNEFYNSQSGCRIENTGDKMRNLIRSNAFNNIDRASSVFGDNNALYLSNCFLGTNIVDIEMNNGASIYIEQGTEDASAGNCFEDDARIQTGTGTEHFTYWTKVGYNNPTVCEHPGSGNFDIELALNETEHDECGVQDSISSPPTHCECDLGQDGCIDAIDSIRLAIAAVDSNQILTEEQKALLIADFDRCLDDLMRQYVHDVLGRGDVEDAISYLAAQPEFPYRVMSYGIMVHNLEYDRARGYLDTLNTSREEEHDFVEAQQIYLEYIIDIDSFKLSAIDSFRLAKVGEKFNPYAGYARSIFYLLTRQWIERNFEHLDSTVTQRNSTSTENPLVKESVIVFPNPSDKNPVNVLIGNFDPESIYRVDVYTLFGKMMSSKVLTNSSDHVFLGDIPGIYFIMILKDNRIVSANRIIRN